MQKRLVLFTQIQKKMMRFDTEIPQDMQDCIEKWRNYSKNHESEEA